MIDTYGTDHFSRRTWHGSHQSWAYRSQAFRWMDQQIAGVNFLPLAKMMRGWMLRHSGLPIISSIDRNTNGGYTNPYTFNGVSLVLIMSRIINSQYEYATQTSDIDKLDAEIERLRLYNEIVLYSTRICEVAIKQLLYCTQFPESMYKRMALGALLESPCPTCTKKNGLTPHSVSLVGSLAHPFHLCFEFDHW